MLTMGTTNQSLHKFLEIKKMGGMHIAKKILTDVQWIAACHCGNLSAAAAIFPSQL